MKRISLALAATLTCLLLASVGTAAAMPTEENVNTSLHRHLQKRDRQQDHGHGRRQERRSLTDASRRLRDRHEGGDKVLTTPDREAEGRRRLPLHPDRADRRRSTVEPQVVKYNCLFRGADTATEIRLKFKVTYNTD